MRELSQIDRIRRFFPAVLCMFVVATSFVQLPEVAGAATTTPLQITKVLVADHDVRELTNTGTLSAINRIFASERMPIDAKTQAITEILTGAAVGGSLVPTTLVDGDYFFALDATTGEVIVVQFTTADFVMPGGGTGFTDMHIPIG